MNNATESGKTEDSPLMREKDFTLQIPTGGHDMFQVARRLATITGDGDRNGISVRLTVGTDGSVVYKCMQLTKAVAALQYREPGTVLHFHLSGLTKNMGDHADTIRLQLEALFVKAASS